MYTVLDLAQCTHLPKKTQAAAECVGGRHLEASDMGSGHRALVDHGAKWIHFNVGFRAPGAMTHSHDLLWVMADWSVQGSKDELVLSAFGLVGRTWWVTTHMSHLVTTSQHRGKRRHVLATREKPTRDGGLDFKL